MISLRFLRLDASLILFMIVGICAAGGFFFAFYETEEMEQPLAVVRHRAPDPQPRFPIPPISHHGKARAELAPALSPASPSPNEKPSP